MKPYITVKCETQTELVIKRSRFIATIAPIEDYNGAMRYVADIKNRFSDATHNCYAYISDENGYEFKFGDDGEPQGTAGQPILEVLKKKLKQVTNKKSQEYQGERKLF